MNLDIKDDGSPQEDISQMQTCMEQAGGQLLVNAQPGAGTTITLILPAVRRG